MFYVHIYCPYINYTFNGNFNCMAGSFILISFIKIIVVLDSSYFKTYKTTPSLSFYTVYCERYGDNKTFGDRWRPSEISPQKVNEENGKLF